MMAWSGISWRLLLFQANERDITGLTREEAVVYLTSLKGLVSMVVQYRKEGKRRQLHTEQSSEL